MPVANSLVKISAAHAGRTRIRPGRRRWGSELSSPYAHRYREEDMGDRLKKKVALVSGAGSSGPGWGNGKATAVLFAREGAKVLAADINLDAAHETTDHRG